MHIVSAAENHLHSPALTPQQQTQEWVQGLAFAVDITDHLNNLNRMLQGHYKVVPEYYDNRQAFKSKLAWWEMLLSNNNPAHFPCLRDAGSTEHLAQYKDYVSSLLQQ